jgi:acyl carrier protein
VATKTERDVLDIIGKALEVDEQSISLDSSPNTLPQWDSLGQINIIVALDEALGGGVSELGEMATAGSARRIVEILREHGKIANG